MTREKVRGRMRISKKVSLNINKLQNCHGIAITKYFRGDIWAIAPEYHCCDAHTPEQRHQFCPRTEDTYISINQVFTIN